MIATSAAVNRVAPRRSSRPGPVLPAAERDSGTSLRASASAAMPIGTLIQKITRQPSPSTFAAMSTPPSSWPPTAAMPMTMP